jgi:hypothetical protein
MKVESIDSLDDIQGIQTKFEDGDHLDTKAEGFKAGSTKAKKKELGQRSCRVAIKLRR